VLELTATATGRTSGLAEERLMMTTRPGEGINPEETYLRTLYELAEEGIMPMRARIAERVGHSGTTVSQTVARMARGGLLRVADDRQIRLTADGWRAATAVMRKHRLAERLLADVVGIAWEDVHHEASGLQHVLSEAAERRIAAILVPPLVSPHGNPIPGLKELGLPAAPGDTGVPEVLSSVLALAQDITAGTVEATVIRISERLQADRGTLRAAASAGLVPGRAVSIAAAASKEEVSVWAGARWLTVDRVTAGHVFARASSPPADGLLRPAALRLR
jgi:DtxR family transcriptional regulator, Mn-dependent transcriptional regulator